MSVLRRDGLQLRDAVLHLLQPAVHVAPHRRRAHVLLGRAQALRHAPRQRAAPAAALRPARHLRAPLVVHSANWTKLPQLIQYSYRTIAH